MWPLSLNLEGGVGGRETRSITRIAKMMNPVSFFCPVCSRRTNQKPRAFSSFLSDQQKSARVCLSSQNQKIASSHSSKISLNAFLLTCAAAKHFHSHRNMAIPGPWIKSHIPSVDRWVNWLLY